MKIGNKILILLLGAILIAVLSVSLLGYYVSKSTTTQLSDDLLKENADVAVSKIEGWLYEKATIIGTAARTFQREYKSYREIEDDHLNIFPENSGVLSIYTVFENGDVRDCAGWRPDSGDDLRTRDYYINAVNQDEYYYSDVYLDSDTKQYVITISKALKSKSGQLWGVIALDVSLGDISKFLEQMEVFRGYGNIVLLSSTGNIMYHDDTKLQSKTLTEATSFTTLGELILKTENDFINGEYAGNNSTIYVETVPKVKWSIGFAVPKNKIYQSTNRLRIYFISITLILMSIGLISSWIYARKLKKDFANVETYISEIANYNLAFELAKDYSGRGDEIGVIYNNVTELKFAFLSLVTDIKNSSNTLITSSQQLDTGTQTISLSSEEISRAIEDLAQGATSQAENTESGAAEVLSLGEIIQQNTALSQSVLDANKSVVDAVNDGLTIVEDLVQLSENNQKASDEVYRVVLTTEENSRKISEASEMIASIADQTNLLALNAAIEAARAGESGRGFAVVAEEIRKLAEESSKSTVHINEAVTELVSSASTAVTRMKEITDNAEIQNEKVAETKGKYAIIHEATNHTEQTIDKLYNIGVDIDDKRQKLTEILESLAAIAEENAASTEETSAGTQEQAERLKDIATESNRLVEIANRLNEEIKKFNI